MTSKESHILLFGDHTERNIRLEELYEYSKQSKNMKTFLQDSFQSIQLVLLDLSESEKKKFEFSSFQSIAMSLATSPSPDVALRTVLLCVAQLGYLIATLETDPQIREIWMSQKMIIVGSCAGQVPAAIAASTQSIDELVEVAPEAVAISLKVGLDADRRTASISDDRSQSWARAAFGVSAADAQAAIERFQNNEVIDARLAVYVGATSAWATTILGPPQTLHRFFSSSPFGNIRHVDLPVTAAFHASHLDKPDTSRIVGTAAVLQKFVLKNSCFFSCSSGLAFQPQSLSELLAETVLNVLYRMTDNEKVFSKVQSRIHSQTIYIIPIVAENISKRLVKTLERSNAHIKEIPLIGGAEN